MLWFVNISFASSPELSVNAAIDLNSELRIPHSELILCHSFVCLGRRQRSLCLLEFYHDKIHRLRRGVSSSQKISGATLIFREPYIFHTFRFDSEFRIDLISDYPRPIFPCRLFGLVVAELIILSVFNLIGQVLLFDIMVRIAVRIEIILSFRQVALSVIVLVL